MGYNGRMRMMMSLVLAMAGMAAGEVRENTMTLETGGKTITMEVFSSGGGPGVVVLHGADGLGGGTAMGYRLMCRELARRGYVAFLPHYFERTGTKTGGPGENVANFRAWSETIKDVIEKARKAEGVQGEKVGLLGFSLGAFLSLSVATHDQHVAVVIDFFGGLPAKDMHHAKGMPPVLILHGDADKLVPVAQAHKLEAVLKENAVPYEMKIYEGQGHGFRGEARVDSMKRTAAFLAKYLGEPK
jgi:carboxymethylenebutenolidase